MYPTCRIVDGARKAPLSVCLTCYWGGSWDCFDPFVRKTELMDLVPRFLRPPASLDIYCHTKKSRRATSNQTFSILHGSLRAWIHTHHPTRRLLDPSFPRLLRPSCRSLDLPLRPLAAAEPEEQHGLLQGPLEVVPGPVSSSGFRTSHLCWTNITDHVMHCTDVTNGHMGHFYSNCLHVLQQKAL